MASPLHTVQLWRVALSQWWIDWTQLTCGLATRHPRVRTTKAKMREKLKLHVLQTSLVIAKLVNKLKSNCPALDSLVACLLVAQLDDLYYIYLDFCFDHLYFPIQKRQLLSIILDLSSKVGWKWKWSNVVRKSEMSLSISITNNVKSCKKINETIQSANFTDFPLIFWFSDLWHVGTEIQGCLRPYHNKKIYYSAMLF